ncbi:hypothetical protein IQ279_08235 [Streptomyces verrucosisporus]|uniref:hypothetical protein n=1 Tax=Streptomyces verrucosisporus TaxID=1695161 RepID=UPI0019CF8FF1|nr:hypothetical protein [Streptomyces verrucosisporus]MBN3929628.1 hypothetical protein [Streptomyces verrucosisporus]
MTGDDGQVSESAPYTPRVVKENWPEKVPTRGLAKGMVLPLEQYMVSYAEEIAVQQARDNAEIACMRRYGFTHWRTEDRGTSPPPADNASNMPRRYGLSDLAEAKKYGHHLPGQDRGSAPVPGQDTSEANTVLLGENKGEDITSFKGRSLPEGGCMGEVGRTVGNLDMDLVERLNGESFERSQQTPAVKDAMARWASCMKDRGYQVEMVWDTTKVVEDLGETASEEGIKIATAEVECKQETDLIKIWFYEETKIQKQIIADNQKALSGAQGRQEKTLGEAAGVNKAAAR